jgi:hypothetical protein
VIDHCFSGDSGAAGGSLFKKEGIGGGSDSKDSNPKKANKGQKCNHPGEKFATK